MNLGKGINVKILFQSNDTMSYFLLAFLILLRMALTDGFIKWERCIKYWLFSCYFLVCYDFCQLWGQ